MKIIKFPQIRQAYEYDCGAEVLRGVLALHGLDVKEETILELADTDTKTGTLVDNVLKVLKRYGIGFETKSFSAKSLKECIKKGTPVILLVQAWSGDPDTNWKETWSFGHYVVAIGYDRKNIYFADPYSTFTTYLSDNELESRWRHRDPLGNEYVNFGIIVSRPKSPFDAGKTVHMD
jgi:ABC-type bacteriocin/lantibiotic exporter with double-glycine peptidase domain